MRPTDDLLNHCRSDWDAATDHVFCRELADGTLPQEKMRWYLAQDYKFVDQFVRLLATAIAHVPALNDAAPAARFLALVTSTENTYFLRSFEALGMTGAEQNPAAAPETIAFQNLMSQARQSGRYMNMIAVLLAAEWTYLTWADRYTGYSDDLPFWYAEWIDLHSGPGFEGVVNYLRDQFDKHWSALPEAEKADAVALFASAMKYERAFFDAAWNAA